MPAPDRKKLDAVSYDKRNRQVHVRFADGRLVAATLEALKVPDVQIERIELDQFRRGIEFHLANGEMHDVAADYLIWLTDAEYAARYPTDDDLAPRVGANVARLRKARGLSQGALAEAADLLAPNVSRLEAGKHVPTLDVLLRVANALAAPLSELLLAGEAPKATRRRLAIEFLRAARPAAPPPPRPRGSSPGGRSKRA